MPKYVVMTESIEERNALWNFLLQRGYRCSVNIVSSRSDYKAHPFVMVDTEDLYTTAFSSLEYGGYTYVNLKKDGLPKEIFMQKEKPIKIGGYEVTFLDNGSIKVGCTVITLEELETMYEKAMKKKGECNV